MEIEDTEEVDQAWVAEDMALDHIDLEELGDDMVGIGCKPVLGQVVYSVVWTGGDRIAGLHTESLADCTAAMLDMDNHMATAAGTEVRVMAAMAMFAKPQGRKTSFEQEMPLEAGAEALCWIVVAVHSTTVVMS